MQIVCYSILYRNGSDILPQIVLNFNQNEIKDMRQYYKTQLTETPIGALFRAKTDHCVITGYRSGKVLFQGARPDIEFNKWEQTSKQTSIHEQTKRNKSFFEPPDTLYSSFHIGSDEAGTGDYFGPITVGATYVTPESITNLKKIGVKDSKALSDNHIQELAAEIMSLKIPYALLVLPNEKYNTLQKQGWTQGKMKAMLHHHAIQKLLRRIVNQPLNGILIDQFCEPSIYKRHLNSEHEAIQNNLYFKTKAESHSIAVAAGSILARTRFLQAMEDLSANAGMTLPKGASQKVDRVIAVIKQKYGSDYLDTCAKVHFANTHKANAYL